MSKKIEQHYIPRVYLKQFEIDHVQNKSFVYCIDFYNKYNTGVQRKGLNDRVFKKKKYYNDNRLIDPFAIENLLGTDFEPKYTKIINFIESERPLPSDIVSDLMTWLYISKMRSPYFRVNSERFIRWYIDVTNGYNNYIPTEAEKKDYEKYISNASREVHLDAFSDMTKAEGLLKTHIDTLNAKQWRILKSYEDFPFWTNDNPGFSPDMNAMFAKQYPFHGIMELNASSFIYYVLTPRYCLEISPFYEGTPLDVCAMNMEIKFEQAGPELIDFINTGVYHTLHKLIISNSKKLLENCIKFDNG